MNKAFVFAPLLLKFLFVHTCMVCVPSALAWISRRTHAIFVILSRLSDLCKLVVLVFNLSGPLLYDLSPFFNVYYSFSAHH